MAVKLAEDYHIPELYKEASRFLLDNFAHWQPNELAILSPETLLKVERRRTYFLERLLKLVRIVSPFHQGIASRQRTGARRSSSRLYLRRLMSESAGLRSLRCGQVAICLERCLPLRFTSTFNHLPKSTPARTVSILTCATSVRSRSASSTLPSAHHRTDRTRAARTTLGPGWPISGTACSSGPAQAAYDRSLALSDRRRTRRGPTLPGRSTFSVSLSTEAAALRLLARRRWRYGALTSRLLTLSPT